MPNDIEAKDGAVDVTTTQHVELDPHVLKRVIRKVSSLAQDCSAR